MSAITLKYWSGRGLMEVPRLMLALSGKFPGEGYTDGRFQAAPETGLEANLGRMPVLSLESGESVGQSAAINYYVAAENGFMGDNNLEGAQIIAISEHIKEMMTAWRGLVPYGTEPSPETIATWFTTGADDVAGAAVGANRSTRYATWYLGRIEAVLGSNGFAVGGKLSLADVLLFNLLADNLTDETAPADTPVWKKETFGSKAATEAALSKYPKIKASVDAVAANPLTQRWMSSRGVQYF